MWKYLCMHRTMSVTHDLYVSDYVYNPGVKRSDGDARDDHVPTESKAKCSHSQADLQHNTVGRDCPKTRSAPPTIKGTKLLADASILIPTTDKYFDHKRSPSELLFLGTKPLMANGDYGHWTKHWVSINSCQPDL